MGQLDAVALKNDNSVLAYSGSFAASPLTSFVFFIDPITGGKKSNYFYFGLDFEIKFLSSSMIFAGQNRLYLTGEVNNRGKNGAISTDFL